MDRWIERLLMAAILAMTGFMIVVVGSDALHCARQPGAFVQCMGK